MFWLKCFGLYTHSAEQSWTCKTRVHSAKTIHTSAGQCCSVCSWSVVTYSILNVCLVFFLSKLRENKKTAELIKTANLLFNSFEPYYMWDYIARWFEECCRFVGVNQCVHVYSEGYSAGSRVQMGAKILFHHTIHPTPGCAVPSNKVELHISIIVTYHM